MNNYRTEETINPLCLNVSMIPRGAEELSLERVGQRFAGSNGTLVCRSSTIVPRRISQQKAMPVHGSSLGRPSDSVVDSDFDGIAPIGF